MYIAIFTFNIDFSALFCYTASRGDRMNPKSTFADYIRTEDILFKHAKGMRDIIGLEFHPFHELFLFVGGDAEFVSDSFRAPLTPGTLVIIPKESFHTFVVHGKEEEYHRYIFNFGDIPVLAPLIEEKMVQTALMPVPMELQKRFEKLGECIGEPQYKKELRVQAMFTDLLLEIKNTDGAKNSAETIPTILADAIRYIASNVAKIGSVEEIARAVNVSASYLSHLFRRELHISPHRYLLEQRLVHAHRKIVGGCGAVQAAEECGFGNYSGFYKMYKKMFGTSPSAAAEAQKKRLS